MDTYQTITKLKDTRLQRLVDFWAEKKGERLAPRREDFQPWDFPHLLPNIFLVDVIGMPPRFRFRLVGTMIVIEYGSEITGRFVDEIDLDNVMTEALDAYKRVIRDKVPVMHHAEFTRSDGRHVHYERVTLPLSKDGVNVDMLLGAAVITGFG